MTNIYNWISFSVTANIVVRMYLLVSLTFYAVKIPGLITKPIGKR